MRGVGGGRLTIQSTVPPDIRFLREEDETALSEFFASNDREEITKHFHPFPLDQGSAQQICEAGHKDRYFAAFFGSAVVGFGMLRGWEEGFVIPSFGVLVDRRARSQGIGRRLTLFAIETARALGCPAIRLTVHLANERAVDLYTQCGFEICERLPDERLVMKKEFTCRD